MLKLTQDNYFSDEANREFFSVSQIKSFCRCEAAAMAEMNGEYVRPKTTALLVGSYVDSYFEGTLDNFRDNNPEIFKKDGTLKADYIKADAIIKRIEADELFMKFMSGKKQVVKTGLLDGYPFKIKMDSYFPKDKIVDLKVMRSLERIMGVSLVEHWRYDWQGAIYQHIEGGLLPFYLAIATKEDVTNIEVCEINQWNLNKSLEDIRKVMPRIAAVKSGEVEPHRCGTCPYCISTKKITEPIDSDVLGFDMGGQ